ncbi:hypothetical protein [Burkholderia pseudomultivorans]|uniref:hypothetical protein n=1 Tax=Burkholderia pseudomultivorans TaxID=1207504 RepID=UPI0007C8111E|nr:hypothetical protein [Burkholderia pseudomultivorans]
MTKRICLFLPVIVFWSTAAMSAGNAETENVQIVSGGCNVVLNVVNGSIPKIPPTYCSQLSAVGNIADSLKKLERYVEASNPTEVKLSGVELEMWAGDEEDYLTLTLGNDSNLPAQNVKILFLAPVRLGETTSRRLSFTPSRAIPKGMLSHLGVSRKGALKIPVAPVSELVRFSRNRIPDDYELLGVGASPNIPDEMIRKYAERRGIEHGYSFLSSTSSLGVQIRYETIFGGKSSLLTGVYLYFAKVTPMQVIELSPDQ